MRDDLLPVQENDGIYLSDQVHEIPIPDVKQHVIDLPDDDEELVQVKTFQEMKPLIEKHYEENEEVDAFPEIWIESPEAEEKSEPMQEYANEDLMLKEGEHCDIDMEEMQAIIQKATEPNKRFKCGSCPKSFKFYKGLKKHASSHEIPDQNYSCDFCGEAKSQLSFATLATLKRHLFTQHLQEGAHQCKFCLHSFRTIKMYNFHLKMDHGVKKFACRICAKECFNK